jgi:hypothetical protein
MEFSDINSTKDSSLLLDAIHSLSTGGFLKKTRLYSVFNIHKKIRKTRKLVSIREYHFEEWKTEGRKPDKDSSRRRLEFMPRNLD